MNMQLSGIDEKEGKIRVWLENKQEFFDFSPFFISEERKALKKP